MQLKNQDKNLPTATDSSAPQVSFTCYCLLNESVQSEPLPAVLSCVLKTDAAIILKHWRLFPRETIKSHTFEAKRFNLTTHHEGTLPDPIRQTGISCRRSVTHPPPLLCDQHIHKVVLLTFTRMSGVAERLQLCMPEVCGICGHDLPTRCHPFDASNYLLHHRCPELGSRSMSSLMHSRKDRKGRLLRTLTISWPKMEGHSEETTRPNGSSSCAIWSVGGGCAMRCSAINWLLAVSWHRYGWRVTVLFNVTVRGTNRHSGGTKFAANLRQMSCSRRIILRVRRDRCRCNLQDALELVRCKVGRALAPAVAVFAPVGIR